MPSDTIDEAPAVDPVEQADVRLQTVRHAIAAATKAASVAQSSLTTANAARAAMVRAALAGEPIEDAALRKVDGGVTEAARILDFRRDVLAAGADALAAAEAEREAANRLAWQRGRVAEEDALNAALRDRLPGQPTDADLLAMIARDGGFLPALAKAADQAYNDAYNFWCGPPNIPHSLPRPRVITAGQDWQKWVGWANSEAGERLPGWGERSTIRAARIHMAARDHFTAYTKLGLDQVRRLHLVHFEQERAQLPTWRGMIAPGAFVPIVA
jgi:hypothetical protein